MSTDYDALKTAILAVADPEKVSPFNGDMVTLFLHEIEKLVESVIAAEREAMLDRIRPMIVQAEECGAKEEREACAKVCDRIASAIRLYCNEAHVVACAEAIRKRPAP